MGIMKSEYIDYLEKKDREFAEGVQEENARTSKFYADRMDNRPQHVIDEEKVGAAIERMHDQRQWDMYNDDTWNWSGLR